MTTKAVRPSLLNPLDPPEKVEFTIPGEISRATGPYEEAMKEGYDLILRPIRSVPVDAIERGRLEVDGKVLKNAREAPVIKAAIEPVWYLPGVAKRFGCTESELRRTLFEQTGGMFPELVTRGDLDVFLPPIGGMTLA